MIEIKATTIHLEVSLEQLLHGQQVAVAASEAEEVITMGVDNSQVDTAMPLHRLLVDLHPGNSHHPHRLGLSRDMEAMVDTQEDMEILVLVLVILGKVWELPQAWLVLLQVALVLLQVSVLYSRTIMLRVVLVLAVRRLLLHLEMHPHHR